MLLSVFALQAQAQSFCPFFDDLKDNKDGTVTDPASGLIWKRCAEGAQWNGSVCAGDNLKSNWFNAMRAAKESRFQNVSDWRLPTKTEFEQVFQRYGGCKGNDVRWFWSSSPTVGNSAYAWGVLFGIGYVNGNLRSGNDAVRLVRASQSSGGNAALEFQSEYAKHVAPLEANLIQKDIIQRKEMEKLIGKLLGFDDFSEAKEHIEKLHQFGYSAYSWKVINSLPDDNSRVYSGSLLQPNEYILAAVASLIKADQKPQTLVLPTVDGTPRSLASRKTTLVKGEFESTTQFVARQTATDAEAQASFDRDQAAYEASKRAYDVAVARQNELNAQALADSKDPEKLKTLAAKHLPKAVALALGNPVLSDITYDADKQVFNAVLKSSRGSFSQAVTVPATLADAPKLKADLLSQKIAPVVTLQLPALTASWALEENGSLRAERFAAARNSVRALLTVIAEYPNSTEAADARQRIPFAQREAYESAVRSNSSSAYQSFISEFAGPDTQKLLPLAERAKQVAAQREEQQRQAKAAQERREQAEREEQYRRDAPAREARERASQMCNAQKQTCRAGCPTWISGADGNNSRHFSCNRQCDSISCY